MTNREFDDLLKSAFDRYAKQTLAAIPKDPVLPDELKKSAKKSAGKRKNTVTILLVAACVGLLALSVFFFAKTADGKPSGTPSDPPPAQSSSKDSPDASLSESVPPTDENSNPPLPPDTVTEQIYPPLFHSLIGNHSGSGDTGEFADPLLVRGELPQLSPKVSSENRTFDKRTGGSSEFWFGDVQIFLQYDTPVLPVAVSYSFGDFEKLPRTCILMGQNPDGSWDELQSYTCKLSEDGVTVAFYLETVGSPAEPARYTDFCLSYHYVAMPDESYEVPVATLYGFEGAASDFRFARYYVSDGLLYAVSTNAVNLTVPGDFAGSTLHTVCSGAFRGDLAPNLTELTLPEGLRTVEAGAIKECDRLQFLSLPATFCLPVSDSPRQPGLEPYKAEIEQNADLNSDGLIGIPLSAIFQNCRQTVCLSVDGENPELESVDGEIYLKGSDTRLYPSD